MSHYDHIRQDLLQRVQHVSAPDFEALALDIFRFQAQYNALYRQFLGLLRCDVTQVSQLFEIPSLPISLFKSHQIRTGFWASEATFTSSGTTGMIASRHEVRDMQAYLQNCVAGFEPTYGHLHEMSILALLPSYLERSGSSLVAMTQHFVDQTSHNKGQSGFFLYDHDRLLYQIAQNQAVECPTLLIGVTYALLDFAETAGLQSAITRPDLLTVMETGGMKGKRAEMTRSDVHTYLMERFGVTQIHSEYGMTELLSQAYAPKNGLFYPAATMRVRSTELNDPFCMTASRPVTERPNAGVLNIIDLVNLDTCAFIATEDLGRVYLDGSFEVIGRADISEARGCNLMVEG
jgi:hypothetical protein